MGIHGNVVGDTWDVMEYDLMEKCAYSVAGFQRTSTLELSRVPIYVPLELTLGHETV